MNKKKVTQGLLVLSCALVFMCCKKKEPNVEPTTDSETQTAIDAAWANYVVSDIEQICAFMGENTLYEHFYQLAQGSGGYVKPVRDSAGKDLSLVFYQATCTDGRFRDGTVRMSYKKDPINNPKANDNANYYRDYGFVGVVTLTKYEIDRWLVTLYDPFAPFYIYNLLPSPTYDIKTTKLSWRYAGKYILIHPSDSTRNIIWDGNLTKELTNTQDPKVFPPTKLLPIKWPLAKVRYYGIVNGSTHKVGPVSNKNTGKPYKMTIDEPNALWRDFTCYPDKIASVAPTTSVGVVTQRFEEYHPFIRGIASFTTGTAEQNIYPRQIYFGNEGHLQWEAQCDNVGEVLIKGISYEVNFRD